MTEKKSKKILIGIIAGVVIGLVTVFGFIFVFILLFLFGGPAKTVKDPDKYAQTLSYYSPGEPGHSLRTGFSAFPETIPDSAFEDGRRPDFYLWFKDTWDDPTAEVYLLCTYSDEDYAAEIDRLKNYTKVFTEPEVSEKKLLYDDSDRFSHPVYLAIDHNDRSYEYAMDLGDNSIAYIYTAWKPNLRNIKKIPKEYLPTDYEESLTMENSVFDEEDSYSIYISDIQYEGQIDRIYDCSR